MCSARAAAQRLKCDALAPVRGEVLEGPAWDVSTERLLFVDIIGGVLYARDWPSGRVDSTLAGESVSAYLPRRRGGEVVACRRGIAVPSPEGLRLVLPLEQDRTWARTNDAKCDPAGRLWVGTMADDEREGAGTLYRVAPDWTTMSFVDGVTISNGLGWSPDGRHMYYIDSPTRRVGVFDYDVDSGTPTGSRVMVDTSEFSGLPDGLTVDSDGCVWVAFFGGSAVRRFAPDGRLLAVVDVPTPNVTSCAFAGPDVDHLVITTARTSSPSAAEPGGDVYVTRPTVAGLPTARFAG